MKMQKSIILVKANWKWIFERGVVHSICNLKYSVPKEFP